MNSGRGHVIKADKTMVNIVAAAVLISVGVDGILFDPA
jgi:hypothetical protein